MLGVGSPAIPHSDSFVKASAGEQGARAAIRAAKALAMTGMDLFNDPTLVDKAKEELREKKSTK